MAAKKRKASSRSKKGTLPSAVSEALAALRIRPEVDLDGLDLKYRGSTTELAAAVLDALVPFHRLRLEYQRERKASSGLPPDAPMLPRDASPGTVAGLVHWENDYLQRFPRYAQRRVEHLRTVLAKLDAALDVHGGHLARGSRGVLSIGDVAGTSLHRWVANYARKLAAAVSEDPMLLLTSESPWRAIDDLPFDELKTLLKAELRESDNPGDWPTVTQAAQALERRKDEITRWCASGELRFVGRGHNRRIDPLSIVRLLCELDELPESDEDVEKRFEETGDG